MKQHGGEKLEWYIQSYSVSLTQSVSDQQAGLSNDNIHSTYVPCGQNSSAVSLLLSFPRCMIDISDSRQLCSSLLILLFTVAVYYTDVLQLYIAVCILPLTGLNNRFAMPGELQSLDCLVAWSSGRALVFGRCAFAVLRSTCSWWLTTYVGKPSAIGHPTRPTQPFILWGR